MGKIGVKRGLGAGAGVKMGGIPGVILRDGESLERGKRTSLGAGYSVEKERASTHTGGGAPEMIFPVKTALGSQKYGFFASEGGCARRVAVAHRREAKMRRGIGLRVF
jgi:hypothetical protein